MIRKRAESTNLQVVYDVSAKSETGFSLNDCLEKEPPLQNILWDVLLRSRFHPVILCTKIEKAFLQIRIRESERDGLRFDWVECSNNDKIEIYHFARLVFRLTQSSFILEGTLGVHFDNSEQEFREVVKKAIADMCVDHLVTGGEIINEIKKLKSDSITLFRQGGFKLHK